MCKLHKPSLVVGFSLGCGFMLAFTLDVDRHLSCHLVQTVRAIAVGIVYDTDVILLSQRECILRPIPLSRFAFVQGCEAATCVGQLDCNRDPCAIASEHASCLFAQETGHSRRAPWFVSGLFHVHVQCVIA